MANPYVGEIRLFAGTFAPINWSFCDGSLLPISEFNALFSLLGTTYGGDGVNTFGLPDLRGRIPLHQGNNAGTNYVIGSVSGTETVTLLAGQMPAHSHFAQGQGGSPGSPGPAGQVWGNAAGVDAYSTTLTTASFSAQAIGFTGGSQPHDNIMPFVAINYIISLLGVYPSQG